MIKMKFRDRWKNVNNCAYTGTVFDGNTKMEPSNYFKNKFIAKEDCADYLNRANGFWGAVVTDGCSKGWMAADRIRSYPLFYAQKDGILYISDDAYWIREECQLEEIDKDAEEEFLMTGYVTGSDTLFVGLKQIQQGEILFFNWSTEGKKYIFSPLRYYRYLHKKSSDELSVNDLLEKFDNVMLASFKRLIDFADGNPIIIPLSGGYDSRLVALMLKRLGYDNLIAYTYGIKNNEEAMISKEVATSLNIPWYFVEYTPEKWYQMYHSEGYRDYSRFAGGLASLPHVQDWIAVQELNRKNIFSKKSIFVPGIVANVGAMGKINYKIYSENSSMSDAIEGILRRHYKLVKIKANTKEKKLISKVNNILGDKSSYISPASALECYNYSERQTKFINNFIRNYEFRGYRHYTPFWDKDLLDFWSFLPFNLRKSDDFYKNYLVIISRMFGLFNNQEVIREKPVKKTNKYACKIYKNFLNNTMLTNFCIFRKIIVNSIKINSQSASYGCFTDKQLDNYIKEGRCNINAMLSSEYIKNIKW